MLILTWEHFDLSIEVVEKSIKPLKTFNNEIRQSAEDSNFQNLAVPKVISEFTIPLVNMLIIRETLCTENVKVIGCFVREIFDIYVRG